MIIRDIAYCRAGDKGNSNNIAVIPKVDEDMSKIKEKLTEENVRQAMEGYEINDIVFNYYDKLNIVNIIIYGALNGGVSENINLDRHGKSFSDLILDIEL